MPPTSQLEQGRRKEELNMGPVKGAGMQNKEHRVPTTDRADLVGSLGLAGETGLWV